MRPSCYSRRMNGHLRVSRRGWPLPVHGRPGPLQVRLRPVPLLRASLPGSGRPAARRLLPSPVDPARTGSTFWSAYPAARGPSAGGVRGLEAVDRRPVVTRLGGRGTSTEPLRPGATAQLGTGDGCECYGNHDLAAMRDVSAPDVVWTIPAPHPAPVRSAGISERVISHSGPPGRLQAERCSPKGFCGATTRS